MAGRVVYRAVCGSGFLLTGHTDRVLPQGQKSMWDTVCGMT